MDSVIQRDLFVYKLTYEYEGCPKYKLDCAYIFETTMVLMFKQFIPILYTVQINGPIF